MLQIIGKVIGALVIFLGVIFIYDARIIAKKFFDFGDQNEVTSGFKILGVIFAVIGGIIFYCMN